MLLFFSSFALVAQPFTIEFAKPELKLKRDKKDSVLAKVHLKMNTLVNGTVYALRIAAVDGRNQLLPQEFKLDPATITITGTGVPQEAAFYLELEADPDGDQSKERDLVLGVDVSTTAGNVGNNNTGTNKVLVVRVKPAEALDNYEYLAYVGTNFDLVDGPKAQNLFFATNMYLPSKDRKIGRTGAFLSLYGNRPVSTIDSAGSTRQLVRVEPTSDSTYNLIYRMSDRRTVFTADNLGAHIVGLVSLGEKLSGTDNTLELFFAPSAEFIFRRTNRITTFSNGVAADTTREDGKRLLVVLPDQYTSESNTYEFRWGPGLFAVHESKRMSVRVYFCVGWTSYYIPNPTSSNGVLDAQYNRTRDLSFSGRVWITERTSGITVQAEVVNSLDTPRPYYGVTLSKALDFSNLGSVFKPLGKGGQ